MATAFISASEQTRSITDAISLASRATGADFHYLLDTAKRESRLDPAAKSTSSSATGLFQFIDQTWLATLKAHGAEHGLANVAGAITQGPGGKLSIADPAERSAILALREDPRIAALMAGEFARDSRNQLENLLGRPVDNRELYLAHFLGPKEAARFISEADWGGHAIAAKSFPEAAASNRAVFFDGSGRARTLAEVKDILTRAHGTPVPAPVPNNISVASADPAAVIPQAPLPDFSDEGTAQAAFLAPIDPGALRLTPQILQILASLDPLNPDREKNALTSTFAAAIGQ